MVGARPRRQPPRRGRPGRALPRRAAQVPRHRRRRADAGAGGAGPARQRRGSAGSWSPSTTPPLLDRLPELAACVTAGPAARRSPAPRASARSVADGVRARRAAAAGDHGRPRAARPGHARGIPRRRRRDRRRRRRGPGGRGDDHGQLPATPGAPTCASATAATPAPTCSSCARRRPSAGSRSGRGIERDRKRPWRLARAFGPALLLAYLLRLCTLAQAMALVSRRLGARVAAVADPDRRGGDRRRQAGRPRSGRGHPGPPRESGRA